MGEGQLDPLVIFVTVVVIGSVSMIVNEVRGVINLLVIFTLFTSLMGIGKLLATLRMYLIPIVFFPLSTVLFSLWSPGVNSPIALGFLVLIKVTSLLLIFKLLGVSLTPDDLLSVLLRLHVPAYFAWVVTSAYRQSFFAVEELTGLFYRLKVGLEGDFSFVERMKRRGALVSRLIIVAYSRAVERAKAYSDTLYIRGWRGAHRDLPLHMSRMKPSDYIVVAFVLVYVFMLFTFV